MYSISTGEEAGCTLKNPLSPFICPLYSTVYSTVSTVEEAGCTLKNPLSPFICPFYSTVYSTVSTVEEAGCTLKNPLSTGNEFPFTKNKTPGKHHHWKVRSVLGHSDFQLFVFSVSNL